MRCGCDDRFFTVGIESREALSQTRGLLTVLLCSKITERERKMNEREQQMKLCIIGTGYVGLVTGVCLADLGNEVIFCDNNLSKIDMLKRKEIPIYEPGLEQILSRNYEKNRISYSTDTRQSVALASVVFVTVGTPEDETGAADLSHVKHVAKEIGESLNEYKVIVNKSTVPVGTSELVRNIIAQESGSAVDFDVVSNPEFLREGSAVEDFMKPDRVVIGASSSRASAIMSKLYQPLSTTLVLTDTASAEMIKYASNAFLATKVSFINAIAHICSAVGADVQEVARGMGLDTRIGPDFLQPGPGFGGSCFPKDGKALIKTADEKGYDFYLLKAVMQVNEDQKRLVGRWVEEWLLDLKDKQVGILGVAFKPDTDDMRESAAINVTEYLRDKGSIVKVYDPIAMDNARDVLDEDTEFVDNAYDAAEDSDALILLTHWAEFKDLDYNRIKNLMKQPYFLDTRNLLDPEEMAKLGFIYKGIGKGASQKSTSAGCANGETFAMDCACCPDNR